MISRFFIDRPIFAAVLSIVIVLAGTIAGIALPITQYPDITPPTVQVSVMYPGASARVVADTVAAPIEQQVNGVENMLYMSSQSGNDGSYNLIITFDLGTDLNTALVMVQNRVMLAVPQLPTSVQKQGLTIKKKSPNILLLVNFYSPDNTYDDIYLCNYATIHCKDELFRLEGVADIVYLGERDYSIRAWLDPQALASRNMTANEVANALASQNLAASPGQVGQEPAARDQVQQQPIDTLGRLTQPEQFDNIIVKVNEGGPNTVNRQLVRLRDVARVELGSQQYSESCTLNGQPTVGLAIYQLPGTNALDVAKRVKKKMEELKKRFPDGVKYQIAYDTTPYIDESISDVIHTLLEAVALVGIVVLVFLQNWRAALIPLIAVPVAIVGTFAVMAMLGFSLNNISLFGLVLAIGIVVDDAIVVVENVERWLHEGLPPPEAARKAMDEVTGAVVAVAVVLCAVFVPCAFISGIPGQFFRQFAVTIAVSTVISAFNSLTLSPALAALLLKPHGARRDPLAWLIHVALGWFFKLFNVSFEAGTRVYSRAVGVTLRGSLIALLIYGGMLGVTYWLFSSYPTGFVPMQDQGWLLVNVQLPDSASLERTSAVMKEAEAIAREDKGVAHTVTVSGMSLLLTANSSNFGSMFVILKPFDERKAPGMHADDVMARLRRAYAGKIRAATVSVFGAPPVPGIGMSSGFKIMVEDRNNLGLPALQKESDKLIDTLKTQRGLVGVSTQFRSNTPQLFMDIDRTKVRALGLTIDQVNQALQIYLGSYYVNNFNEFGRFWQVNVQAEGSFRSDVREVYQIKLRNNQGQMVPLGSLVDVRDDVGPVMVTRYNLYAAAPVNGIVLPPLSSGQAVTVIDKMSAETLPRSMRTEWTDLTYFQIKAGNTAMYVFALAVVFVFLALAALYESWSLPLAVILVVPMCLLCSLVGVMLGHMAMNIFVQIGFVVLVGLACKNAILIVEFAKQLCVEGKPRFEATQEASRLRLRPILMTSFAFILGVFPMVIANGAGAEMRRALGTAVFSGMLGVTIFGIFLTPVFFYVIDGLGEMALFSQVKIRRLGSGAVGALVGLIAGFLSWKIGFPHLRWALFGGASLGAAIAVVVSAGLRGKKPAATAGAPAIVNAPNNPLEGSP